MTNRPPTLSEMQHSLETRPDDYEATAVPVQDVEYVLQHFGVKGMKWGIRRPAELLGRARGSSKVKNEEGEEVGGIRAKSKAAAEKLRNMKSGEVMVLDTVDAGPKVLVKQKDGSFKEATISADAQGVLRTVNKDPSEMSTREMNDAVKRAQAIESYNKLFNPLADPNAELKARVESMELQMKYGQMQAKMNPTRAQKAASLIGSLEPAFNMFNKVDKMMDGDISKQMRKEFGKLTGTKEAEPKQTVGLTPNPKPKKKKRDNVVYDITDVGKPQNDPTNPYIPQL